MRTFHQARAMLLATMIFALLAVFTGKAAQAASENISTGQTGVSPAYPPAPRTHPATRFAELRSKLDHQDRIIALRALHMALTQVPDGGAYMWKRKSRSLKGVIKPSKPFRNAQGQLCRHLVYALALGSYIKQIEGIACRQDDGSWQL